MSRPAPKSRSTDGQVKIHRIVGGTNCGHAVNPEQIARQIEGSFVYGLSAMLYGECTVRGGHIEQKNFDTYQVMRIDEMPKVEAIVMPDGEFWGGVGEPTIAVAAPAVLNAIVGGDRQAHPQLPAQEQRPETPRKAQQAAGRKSPPRLLVMARQRAAKTRRQILHGAASAAAAAALVAAGVARASGTARRHRRRRLCRRGLRPRAALSRRQACDHAGRGAAHLYGAAAEQRRARRRPRELSQQQFGYDKIAAAGIKVAIATATAIDAQARSVTLSTGDTLPYDRLVLAPGIELRFDAIKGYSEAAAQQAPHAWTADAAQYRIAAPTNCRHGR